MGCDAKQLSNDQQQAIERRVLDDSNSDEFGGFGDTGLQIRLRIAHSVLRKQSKPDQPCFVQVVEPFVPNHQYVSWGKGIRASFYVIFNNPPVEEPIAKMTGSNTTVNRWLNIIFSMDKQGSNVLFVCRKIYFELLIYNVNYSSVIGLLYNTVRPIENPLKKQVAYQKHQQHLATLVHASLNITSSNSKNEFEMNISKNVWSSVL